MNIEKIKKKNKGFTLVELIIVITILAILATIAFVSFQGHTKESRDTVRLTDLTNIDKGLELYNIKNSSLPMPDDYITIKVDGEVIGYQGDVGKSASRLIGLTGGKDPLDGSFYTYRISADKKSYQLLGLGEINNKLSFLSTYASSDNSNRYPITKGKELGIILNKNKVPLQQVMTGSLDIATATGQYIGVKSNSNIVEGTGVVLKEINPYYLSKTLGGKGSTISVSVVSDKDLNIYIAGYYVNDLNNTNSFIDFGGNLLPGKGNSLVQNLFLAKIDSSGNQKWIKTIGGNGATRPNKLLIDEEGNLYIGGYFNNNSSNINSIKDFNGNDLNGKSDTSSQDIFISKLDSDGNQEWIRTLGGTSGDSFGDFFLDSNGKLLVGGIYTNNDLNSNSVKDFNGNDLKGKSNTSSQDIFISKLDSNGNQEWLKTLGGTGSDAFYKIFSDNNGNIYTSGTFFGNINNDNYVLDFKSGSIIGNHINPSNQIFISKLDNSGNQLYIKTFGGLYGSVLNGTAVDSNGNSYVLGRFYNNISDLYGVKDFKGQTIKSDYSSDNYDIFLSKLDNNLEQQWIKTLGGSGVDVPSSLVTSSDGNLYVGGYFTNNIGNSNSAKDFNGVSLTGVTSVSTSNSFIAKINYSGVQQWIKSSGTSGNSSVSQIISDSDSNVYVRGSFSLFSEFKDFSGDSITTGLSYTNTQGYIAKLDSLGNQKMFLYQIGKGAQFPDSFFLDKNQELLVISRYHNDNIDTSLAKDFKGFILLGKSNNSALSGSPGLLFQKIFQKDMN